MLLERKSYRHTWGRDDGEPFCAPTHLAGRCRKQDRKNARRRRLWMLTQLCVRGDRVDGNIDRQYKGFSSFYGMSSLQDGNGCEMEIGRKNEI